MRFIKEKGMRLSGFSPGNEPQILGIATNAKELLR
jgi:hypothetical protein